MGLYPKDTQSYYKDMCSPMFIVALFINTRTWKQPKCQDQRMDKKNIVVYTMEYYTADKNNDI